MTGGDSNAVPFHVYCYEEWKSHYGTSPPWGKKEFSQLADARKRLDTEQLAREAWEAFLASTDPFHEGHSPGKFLVSLSQMTARAVKAIPKPKKQEDGELVAKLTRMARISAEVDRDPTIPESERKNEYKRRWAIEA